MDKFCTNCGEKIVENAMFCLKCGLSVNSTIKPQKKELKGLGITSLILGLIGSITACFNLFRIILNTNSVSNLHLLKILVLMIPLLFPIILGILTIIFGAISYCRSHSIINLSGLVLGFFTFVFCILCLLIICLS